MKSRGHFQKLFQHLLSPGTWLCSLRGSLSPRKAPDTSLIPRRIYLLPRGGTRAALNTGTHSKLPRSPLSWSLKPTHTCSLRVPDHLSHPCLTPSIPEDQNHGSGRKSVGKTGMWKLWRKASLFCPQKGAELGS